MWLGFDKRCSDSGPEPIRLNGPAFQLNPIKRVINECCPFLIKQFRDRRLCVCFPLFLQRKRTADREKASQENIHADVSSWWQP